MNENEIVITVLTVAIMLGTTVGAYLEGRNTMLVIMLQILHVFIGILIGITIN